MGNHPREVKARSRRWWRPIWHIHHIIFFTKEAQRLRVIWELTHLPAILYNMNESPARKLLSHYDSDPAYKSSPIFPEARSCQMCYGMAENHRASGYLETKRLRHLTG
jgi:hypothetical protein